MATLSYNIERNIKAWDAVKQAIIDKGQNIPLNTPVEDYATKIKNIKVSAGTATTSDVLSGKTFSNDNNVGLVGTMPNRGAGGTKIPTTTNQTLQSGYYSSDIIISGDSNLIAGNIKNGVSIFGITGNLNVATGTATAAQVLSGYTFSNNSGINLSGSMPNRGAGGTKTPGTANQTLSSGYYSSDIIISGSANLLASNIKNGINIFGVTGTVSEAVGTAAAAQVLTGYTFSNSSGSGLSGSMANRSAPTWTPGTSNQSLSAGYYSGGTITGSANLIASNIKDGINIFGVIGNLTGSSFVGSWSGGGSSNVTGSQDNGTYRRLSWSNLTTLFPTLGSIGISRIFLIYTLIAGYSSTSTSSSSKYWVYTTLFRSPVTNFSSNSFIASPGGNAMYAGATTNDYTFNDILPNLNDIASYYPGTSATAPSVLYRAVATTYTYALSSYSYCRVFYI